VSIIESLKKLVDPGTARDEQARRRAAMEAPARDDAADEPDYECRVCAYVGVEPLFCPECLAETMRPTGKRRAEAASPPQPSEPEPVTLTPDGTLDLHTFKPSEVGDLIAEYVETSAARGLRHIRVVHGKGTGRLKRTVERALAREPLVEHFVQADESAGGWGATLVTLRRHADQR
jgi:hypothetical protein